MLNTSYVWGRFVGSYVSSKASSGFLDPRYLTFKLLGSYSLVGIGKFKLLFLWLIGVVGV